MSWKILPSNTTESRNHRLEREGLEFFINESHKVLVTCSKDIFDEYSNELSYPFVIESKVSTTTRIETELVTLAKSQEQLDLYKQLTQDLEENSDLNEIVNRNLGMAFGFPKTAIDFFVSPLSFSKVEHLVAFYYRGLMFLFDKRDEKQIIKEFEALYGYYPTGYEVA